MTMEKEVFTEPIMVSVYCLTYNHAKYIEDALEGFVKQRTNFKFHVIVHDDASTDGTQDIILAYKNKYPNLFDVIIQKENQYSKGTKIFSTYIAPLIKGKYVAACEGDDFWCDENKLQKEVDFLEGNNDYVACVHNTKLYNQKTGKSHNMFGEENRIITIEDVLAEGKMCYHTSTLLARKEYILEKPKFTYLIPFVGDFPLSIYLSGSGKIKYFKDVMSVYRYCTQGSWTMRNFNLDKRIETAQNQIMMYQAANDYFNNQYECSFDKAILHSEFYLNAYRGNYKVLKEKKYKSIWKHMSVSTWVLYKIASHIPTVFVLKWKYLG